ncbi:hypothetical protein GW17_00040428 [Ensete ventricosum]|nr:hypothetical protein GW17_00040428 [Ensete ventricosum]RZS06082.1 hypothetical protein BHM03_00036679 [Ensete ventricosum]
MILTLENYDLSLLDICPIGATFLLHSSHWKFRRLPSPLDYSVLLNNLCLVLPLQMHLLDCDHSPIQSPLHPLSGKIRIARYIPVRQLTGTRTDRYRVVPLRSIVDGRFPLSMVDFRRLRSI